MNKILNNTIITIILFLFLSSTTYGFSMMNFNEAVEVISEGRGYASLTGEQKSFVHEIAESWDELREEFYPDPWADDFSFGASLAIPTTIALFETSLQSKITSTASSLTLTSATDKDGNTLASSTYAFILDEGTASEEFVICDCTGTACTNCDRGISVLTGTSTVAALKKTHRRGASVKITDAPLLMNLTRIINGIGTFPNRLSYTTEPTFTAGTTQIPTVKYVDDTNNQGAATSTETYGGIAELATKWEVASGTPTTVTKPLVVQAEDATSTPGADVAASGGSNEYYLVMSEGDGTIAHEWIKESDDFDFSGSVTINNASTTLIDSATTTVKSATTTLTDSGAVLGVGTTTPTIVDAGVSIVGDTYIDGGLGVGHATTSDGNLRVKNYLQVDGTASTTDLIISGSQTGGSWTYTASSTAGDISTTKTFTGSIPTNANFGLGNAAVSDSALFLQADFTIARTGKTTSVVGGTNATASYDGLYTFSWSGSNLVVTETTDVDSDSSIAFTIYWYR